MSSHQLIDRPSPTAPTPAAASGTRAALRRARSRQARRLSLPARYLGYVGYFVGAGLISGAVVHHPLDPDRYTRIAVYGVLVFLAATILNEFVLTRERPGLPRVLTVIGASLMLSFGIGMLSGGLQHFADFPARGAVLVPLGLVVSFTAFVIKDADTSWRRLFSLVGLAVLVAATITFFGLRQVAASKETAESGGHGHGTAEGAEPEQHAPAATPAATSVPAPSASSKSGAAKPTSGHSDGDSH
ncbi:MULTISPECIES: hypothetical protein [Streptomyces]|uniref:hypothetical protein n=1 Tax=Streptomyces TaxID=1883 RepID=UPI002257DCCD|nr:MULTISPECIES: hypothetical protein [Streptomyces]MCX5275340.1 hypothetical protein [Streptomyces virginiae]MCX5582951.1 hypothetical protein [Streptomyces erythrochromogenes]